MSVSLKKPSLINNSTDSIASGLSTSRQRDSRTRLPKRRQSKDQSITESLKLPPKDPIPQNYCVSIYVDGASNMDRVSHLNSSQIGNPPGCLEHRLRPISGIRNHIRRNLKTNQSNLDLMRETDLVDRIGSIKTVKRLDLSGNGLRKFPIQLCDLDLTTLNLTNNQLEDSDFPAEIEKLQNLIELKLDSNNFKHIPKPMSRLKKLERLSMRDNSIVDLKHVQNFKQLKFLILDSNSITQIEENVAKLKSLEILHLKHNSIVSVDTGLLKANMAFLKQLDLSYNKLSSVALEVFMLPNLEMLNLSNNKIGMLPIVPTSYFRTTPIFLCDLSSNKLIRFYEFLLTICDHVDMSCNRIKTIPMKAFEKLTLNQIEQKVLKIEDNPLVEPPVEFCKYGLKVMKEYFEEANKDVQLNKGFKMIFLGDKGSGKSLLAHALEDFHSQSNLVEQFHNQAYESKETKFVEIHEFFIKNAQLPDKKPVEKKTLTFNLEANTKTLPVLNLGKIVKTKKTLQSPRSATSSFRDLTEYNTISNEILTKSDEPDLVKSHTPVCIYDFNGSLSQFHHLIDMFLDKTALLVICVDASSIHANECDPDGNAKWETHLRRLLDLIVFKMNKTTLYSLIVVLTKWDKIAEGEEPQQEEFLVKKVERLIAAYFESRLEDIRAELAAIETAQNISASQSDRLKQLVQTQKNLKPEIYRTVLVVSSVRNKGVKSLSEAIQEIVLGDTKRFPFVNSKIPTFWIEAERFASSTLSRIPKTKFVNGVLKISQACSENQMSQVCVDYDLYKKTVVEKYGMNHLIDSLTRYFSSCGKFLWFQDSEKLKQKVFLRPNILFDMLFTLFRTNFNDNFTEDHVQTLRAKLVRNTIDTSEENLNRLKNDLLTKGQLNMDLLKLIWFPILITDSSDLIRDAIILFSSYFNVCYPDLSKDKLKLLFISREITKDNVDTFRTIDSQSFFDFSQLSFTSTKFTNLIVPFYLPPLNDLFEVNKIREGLVQECQAAAEYALLKNFKKEKSTHLARLVHKYVFPWGILPGIFDKFSTCCLLNSDLQYKYHYKNFILAYNESKTIGVIIHTNSTGQRKAGETDEVTFEFYLLSYAKIIEQLELEVNLGENDEHFDHTLSMDLDHIWILALKILNMFEENINLSYPSLRFDRYSKCPECELFSFLGEWVTPKELQKNKGKKCVGCEKIIDCSFLVKPTTGQNTTLDISKLRQRLNNLAEFKLQTRNLKLTSLNNRKIT